MATNKNHIFYKEWLIFTLFDITNIIYIILNKWSQIFKETLYPTSSATSTSKEHRLSSKNSYSTRMTCQLSLQQWGTMITSAKAYRHSLVFLRKNTKIYYSRLTSQLRLGQSLWRNFSPLLTARKTRMQQKGPILTPITLFPKPVPSNQ